LLCVWSGSLSQPCLPSVDSSLRHVQTIAWAPREYGCPVHLCTLHHGSPTSCVAPDRGPVASRVLPDWCLTKSMLVQNMAVKNGDIYGDICGVTQSRLVTTKAAKRCHNGRSDKLSSGKELISVCEGRCTNERVPKIIAISRASLVRNQRDGGLIIGISLSN
jgi:hypothetical protein